MMRAPASSPAPATNADAAPASAQSIEAPAHGAMSESTMTAGAACECGCNAKVGDNQPGLTLQEVRGIIRSLLTADKPLRTPERDAKFYHAVKGTGSDAAAGHRLHTTRDVVASWRSRFGLAPMGMSNGCPAGMLNTGRTKTSREGFPPLTVYVCSRCEAEVIGQFKAREHSKTCPKRPPGEGPRPSKARAAQPPKCCYCKQSFKPRDVRSNSGLSHKDCARNKALVSAYKRSQNR